MNPGTGASSATGKVSRPSINNRPAVGLRLRLGGAGIVVAVGALLGVLVTRAPQPTITPAPLTRPLPQQSPSQTIDTTRPVLAAPRLVSDLSLLPPPGQLASQPSGWLPAKVFEEPEPPLPEETGAQRPEDGPPAPPAFDLPLPPASLVPEVLCSSTGPVALEPISQPIYGLQGDGVTAVEPRPAASAKRLRKARAKKLSCKSVQQYMSLKDKALLEKPAIAELKIPAEVPGLQPGLVRPDDSILTTSSQDSLIDLGR